MGTNFNPLSDDMTKVMSIQTRKIRAENRDVTIGIEALEVVDTNLSIPSTFVSGQRTR
jgi:hypothetical protein